MTPEDTISEALATLGEHFEVIQLFVQVHDGEADRTETWSVGRGNHLARVEQVRRWMARQDESEELTD